MPSPRKYFDRESRGHLKPSREADSARPARADKTTEREGSHGQPLNAASRAFLEPRFGHSFENVRVYNDAEANESARSLGASAYTVGQDVFFADGQYEPESSAGLHRLAHEVAHTVQQRDVTDSPFDLGPASSGSESEARSAADGIMAGESVSVTAGGVAAIAKEEAAATQTEAQRAANIVGQFPWMRAMFPQYTFTADGGKLKATRTDGTTTVTTSGGYADGTASIGQRRVIEADKDHSMESERSLSYKNGQATYASSSGGKSLANDGTKVADSSTREISAGANSVGYKGSSTSTRDTVTKTASNAVSLKDGDVSASIERGREFKLDDDHKLGSSYGASVSSNGASVNTSSSSRIKDVETGAVESHKTNKSIGYDGTVHAGYGNEKTTEIDGQKFTKGTNVAVDGKNVTLGSTNSQTQKDAAGNEVTSGSSRSFSVGENGVAYTAGKNDGKGNTSSTTVSGDMSFDAHGNPTGIKAGASYTRNGKSVSLGAGYEIHTSEIKKDGDHFVVEWERKFSANAGGKAKGVGVSGSHSNNEFGSKVFKTEAEALAFKDHAADRLPSHAYDPSTVDGAMHMGIGEMQGAGSASKAGVEASASFAGGSSVGFGLSKDKSSDVKVRRVGQNEFELTYDEGSGTAGNFQASTAIYGMSTDSSSHSGSTRTVKVDVSTPQGKAAFERFTKHSGELSKGAEVTSEKTWKEHESGDTGSVLGASARYYGRTGEDTTVDKRGTTEHFYGQGGMNYNGGPLDSSHDYSSVRFDATQTNGKNSVYSLRGDVDATTGEKSREDLHNLTGTVIDNSQAAGEKSSGKWGVEVQVTPEMIEKFIDNVSDEKIREMGLLDGNDPRNNLRQSLHAAKNSADQKRAIADYVAALGGEGKLIRAMRDTIFGHKFTSGLTDDYDLLVDRQLGNFEYDLTLPGDKNFKGSAAREELEGKIEGFQKQLKDNPAGAGAMHHDIDSVLKEVQRQQKEIGDPNKYQDLPRQLREMQLAKIGGFVSQLQELRTQAGMAFTAADVPVEVAAEPHGAKGKSAAKGKGKPTEATKDIPGSDDPNTKSLQRLRADIGIADKGAKSAKDEFITNAGEFKKYLEIIMKVQYPKGDLPRTVGSAVGAAMRLEGEANGLRDAALPLETATNGIRAAFIESLGTPEVALSVGAGMKSQAGSLKEAWANAAYRMMDAESKLLEVVDTEHIK